MSLTLSPNSAICPPKIIVFGCCSIKATCFSNRSGTQISSVSIRKTQSCEQCFKPSLSALPKPKFFGNFTKFKGNFVSNSVTTASSSGVTAPSNTKTISSAGWVCATRLSKHSLKYCGFSLTYKDIKTENFISFLFVFVGTDFMSVLIYSTLASDRHKACPNSIT